MVEGSPEEDLPVIAPLSALTGARVIVPDYRLAPEHPWPAALDDGFAVYREIAGRPLAAFGESAGGNLSLAWMLRAKAEGLRLPGAALLLSPWRCLSKQLSPGFVLGCAFGWSDHGAAAANFIGERAVGPMASAPGIRPFRVQPDGGCGLPVSRRA